MATRLLVSGRVQGVGYRQWMCAEAERLRLTGWVRNLRDGSVESVVDGSPEAVREMIALAHQGPPAARVEAVRTRDGIPGNFNRFEWVATA